MDAETDLRIYDVALLAEGVDRNRFTGEILIQKMQLPSSRRAWIEIQAISELNAIAKVALLAEGVDRNQMLSGNDLGTEGCPPRGGRG